MSTQEHDWFVSTVLRLRGTSSLREQKGQTHASEVWELEGRMRRAAPRSVAASEPDRWIPEVERRTEPEWNHLGHIDVPYGIAPGGLPGRRWRGIIQVPSDQMTFRATGAILRTPLKGQRDKFREV